MSIVMHAFLIIGKNHEERNAAAEKLLGEGNADCVFTLPPTVQKHPIAAIREIIKSLRVKHFNPGNGRGIIIADAHKLTPEAANAFLKILEQPPKGTIIILTAPSRESVLETVASRCTIIDLGRDKTVLSDNEEKEAVDTFSALTNGSIGERLAYADKITDREEALDFVKKQTLVARSLLLAEIAEKQKSRKAEKLVEILERLEQTRQDLEANVNVKMAISELLLHYPIT